MNLETLTKAMKDCHMTGSEVADALEFAKYLMDRTILQLEAEEPHATATIKNMKNASEAIGELIADTEDLLEQAVAALE